MVWYQGCWFSELFQSPVIDLKLGVFQPQFTHFPYIYVLVSVNVIGRMEKGKTKKLIITDTIIYVFIKWQNGCKLIATESITSKTKLHRKKDNNFPILFSLFKKQHSSSTWSYPSILFHVVRLLAGLLRLNLHPLYS